MAADLDELDYRILHLLQKDARNQTPVDMAAVLPVSDTTVRNRIEKLEEQGVIEGYVPVIDYEQAGFPIRLQVCCTTSTKKRTEVIDDVLNIPQVVAVDELLSARENIRVLAVTTSLNQTAEIVAHLETLPLTVERERLFRRSHVRPFTRLGEYASPTE